MYEYHCWINIDHREYGRQWENGQIDSAEYYKQVDKTVQLLTEEIEKKKGPLKGEYKIIRGSNCQTTLHFSGLRNHHYSKPLEIVNWLKDNAPYSYGLLYIHDDEDSDNEDNFVVYRLARQEITKYKDSLLSPYLDTVEKGYYDD